MADIKIDVSNWDALHKHQYIMNESIDALEKIGIGSGYVNITYTRFGPIISVIFDNDMVKAVYEERIKNGHNKV